MTIIPLRSYNREIEGMIDNGQLDEAVAHCRHILATFPKYIASYRLLGKAHLEQQRISDATDIFQRVLSTIPDDFIANVGMSIIREDENNMDAAIWHMELAYEAQPANLAIQDELRRLYGRRDGMQPPKIRLTRGALARMYAKGGLYDQAIAELRAAISEDPNRPDLQLLLAQMLYQTSQRVEAVEACVNVIKKIPLCLEANRILAISLPEAEGSEGIKNYRQIVVSLDPYYAFAEADAISSDQVPESAVNIERLEWKSGIQMGETPEQPNWATSLGITMEKPPEEKLPDWLSSSEAPAPISSGEKNAPSVSPFIWDTQEVEKIITDTSKPEAELPDWMKDAGWEPVSDKEAQPPQEVKPESPTVENPEKEGLEKANIPEWLIGIAPKGVINEEPQEPQPKEADLSSPWLEPHQPGPTDSIIQWLDEKKPEVPASSPLPEEKHPDVPEEEVPDWLKDLNLPGTPSIQTEKPVESTPAFTSEPSAFIKEPTGDETGEVKPAPVEESAENVVESKPNQAEILPAPEVAKNQVTSEDKATEMPDWLKEIAAETPALGTSLAPVEEQDKGASQINNEQPITEQPISGPETPVEETQANPEELHAPASMLAPEKSPEAEVAPVTEELPIAEAPSTVEAAPPAELSQPSTELTSAETQPVPSEQPLSEQSVPAESKLTPETPAPINETDAFAWLEGIADQQIPKAEETPTPPGEHEIQPPEWVKLEEASFPEKSAEAQPHAEEVTSLPSTEEISSAIPSEETTPAVPAEEIPEWLKGLGETPEAEIGSEAPSSTVAAEAEKEIPQAEELPDWLLELEQPAPEKEESTTSEEALEWKSDELPAWLKEIAEITPSLAAPAAPELSSAAETPSVSAEQPSEPIGEAAQPVAVSQEAVEEPQPEHEARVPETEVPAQPIAAIPIEEVAGPVSAGPAEEVTQPVTAVPAEEVAQQVSAVPSEEVTHPVSTIPAEEAAQPISAITTEEVTEPVPAIPAEQVVQPASVIPAETEAMPVPVIEELTTEAVTIPIVTPAEEAIAPAEASVEAKQKSLSDARNAINQGLPAQAAEFYVGLIKQNYNLDEIIKDLQEALYRFPVDVNMWVNLGDAHFRSDKLQEALDAFTKAEELVR